MNMLSNLLNKIKSSQYHIFLALCIGLIAFISYNLGQIEALEKKPVTIKQDVHEEGDGLNLKADIYSATKSEVGDQKLETKVLDTRVVASKNSDKYHYTWCSGAKKINEANKVWFNSAQEAENRGYTLAGNCQK